MLKADTQENDTRGKWRKENNAYFFINWSVFLNTWIVCVVTDK